MKKLSEIYANHGVIYYDTEMLYSCPETQEIKFLPFEINYVCKFIDKYHGSVKMMVRLGKFINENKKKIPLSHYEFIHEYFNDKFFGRGNY